MGFIGKRIAGGCKFSSEFVFYTKLHTSSRIYEREGNSARRWSGFFQFLGGTNPIFFYFVFSVFSYELFLLFFLGIIIL